jgi:tetratricopeptide (TPR) repeat protein
MTRPLSHLLLALLVALAVAPGTAAAQEDQRAEAERFFRAGESAYNAGQYDVAAQAFEKAYSLLEVPAIAFSTAQAYRLQYFVDKDARKLKRAIELYRSYIGQVDQGGRRDDAITSLAELEPILLRLEAEEGGIQGGPMTRERTTQLMITTQVEGASATIDEHKGEAPLIRQVEPGAHKVTVKAPGYFPVEQTATAVDGEFIVVEIPLRPMPAQVSVRAEAGAEISIDGRPAGTAPLARPIELPAGKHFVTVTRRGRNAWSRELEVARGEQVELLAELRTTGQRRASRWVLGAGGATLIASGVYFGLAWKSGSDAEDILHRLETEGITQTELAEYDRLRDERGDRRTTGFILLGAGSAIAITGALMYVFDTPAPETQPMAAPAEATPSESTTRPLSVVPVVTPEGGGLSILGRF